MLHQLNEGHETIIITSFVRIFKKWSSFQARALHQDQVGGSSLATGWKSFTIHNILKRYCSSLMSLNAFNNSQYLLYCRSLIKVKFSTDQFRPALGSGCWLIDWSIVTMLKKPQNCPISDFFDLTPKYFLPLLPFTDLVPPSTDPVPPSTNPLLLT